MNASARACLIAIALILPSAAVAQESTGNWDVSVWTAGSTGEELTNSLAEAQLWSAGIFVGQMVTPRVGRRWRRGRLEYGVNLVPVLLQARPHVLYGGGFEPLVFRWNSEIRLRGTHPYIELAGGALQTTGNLPSGNTSSFNFTAKGGGGLYVPIHEHIWDVGIRWSHVSNANLGATNPEFNGIELRIAYHWMR